jgi:CHAT domain-containing protein
LLAKETFVKGYQSIGESIAKAVSQFEKSRDLFSQLGDSAEADISEMWAAQLLRDVANIAEARRRLTAIVESSEKKRFKILLPPAYYWLAMNDFHQNEISESHKNLRVALRAAEAGNNPFEVQHAQEALASGYSDLNEFGPALFYASKIVSDRGRYYQNGPQYWRNSGTLTELAVKLNFFSTALSLSRENLAYIQETSRDKGPVIDSLRDLILVSVARKDFRSAQRYANDSMQLARERADGPEKTRTIADIHLLLGDIRRKSDNCNDALSEYDNALEQFARLPEIADSLYRIHKARLFCFQQLDRKDDFLNELKTVLKLSEEYRATIREDDSRQAFFASEQEVIDAAATNAITNGDSGGAFAFIEKSKARSLLDFVASDKTIAEVEKSFGPVAVPLSLTEIQARLPDQVQVVQYAVLPDKLAFWIVSKTRFDFVEKKITAADLEKKIDAYQALVIGKGSPSETRQIAQELFELLIPNDLSGDKQLCVIPDKTLHQLAFASLVSRSGKYLIEDYALSFAPSLSVMVTATENAQTKEQVVNESLLSIGNPDFNREENPNLADLRGAETEARMIAERYQNPLLFMNGEATKENFLTNFTKVEVVHFAGHFQANRQTPGNSKLLFAGSDLRTSELSAYKLPKAKLVLLSACETGFERYNKSEGAIGIARTLLALGSPLVVASQWKVDSEPTKDLMIAFHRNRKQYRMTSAESLRRAQLEILSAAGTKAPFYWAAFSLFGGYANY